MLLGDDADGGPMCSRRWQRDRRDALTWQGTERSPCRQGATRAAQGPDPGLCLPSPQVRPHVTDFADPLPTSQAQMVTSSGDQRIVADAATPAVDPRMVRSCPTGML